MAEPFAALGLSLLAAQDVLEAVLQEVDAAALCQLKAVSAAWCAHARRELCTRLCRYEGASITDLDVESLNDTGRPWEVVVAGRQLPQLARLRGFGFVVDVQAVREAGLGAEEDDDDEEEDDHDEEGDDDGPLGGVALRSCIQGMGDPPRELLLAAVACAASGRVRGVPVQELRENDAIGSLDLDDSGLGNISAALLVLMLPAATSVRNLRCPSDNACHPVSPGPSAPLPPARVGVRSTTPRAPHFLSAPLATPQNPPPLPCSQSATERPRSRRRSRSR